MDQKKLQLQPRLQLLADLVPPGTRLADVGTDHGYLPVWLLQEGRISHAIASDINAAPLEHARRTAAEFGVAENIDFRLCAGLDGIRPDEIDTIVIAGMGGESILSILSAAPWTRSSAMPLLLQPMTKVEMLRIWLADNGYTFTGERLVADKDFLYPVLCVTGGKGESLLPEEAYVGKLLSGDPLYGQYLDQQIKKLRRRITGLRSAAGPVSSAELKNLEELCASLEKKRRVLGCKR